MVSHCQISRVVLTLAALYIGALTGCSDAVQMIQETPSGGIATYLYKDDRGGPMGSPHRREALQAIDRKCPGGHTVIRDGEVKGYSSISSVEGREGEVTNQRWGIQFKCK